LIKFLSIVAALADVAPAGGLETAGRRFGRADGARISRYLRPGFIRCIAR
jgi:hypothetical protein